MRNMTLGELIDALEAADPGLLVYFDFVSLSPTTLASGMPSGPARMAHSSSRGEGTAASTRTSGSCRRASSIAGTSPSGDETFVIPREEPAREGFTKTGSPRASTRSQTPSRSVDQSRSVTTS